jgi:hypothetical protein
VRTGRIDADVTAGWLADLAVRARWAGLMRDDPYAGSDPLAAEVGGSPYARAATSWESVGSLIRTAVPLEWLGLSPGTRAVAVAGFDGPFNGTMLWVAYLERTRSWPGGGFMRLGKGELVLGIDA